MKLPIFLIGEDSLALASLKQQLEKEAGERIPSHVETEEPRRPDPEAPSDPDQNEDA